MKKVPQALANLGRIYEQRNALYGDTYKEFGKTMKGFFPGPVTLETEEQWNRMALFFHCADKLKRYASTLNSGGHIDSLDDLSVYSQMLQEYDAEIREHELTDIFVDAGKSTQSSRPHPYPPSRPSSRPEPKPVKTETGNEYYCGVCQRFFPSEEEFYRHFPGLHPSP